MRVAALDLGSNTTLLLIADVQGGRIEKVLCDETTVTKLGQGVHQNRRFHPEALQRMRECLKSYAGLIAKFQPEKIKAVATSAARDVENKEDLLTIGRDFSIPIEIIEGQHEARLTFFGALEGEPSEGAAVIDVGGGSTEIIYKENSVIRPVSINVGSVRLSDLFVSAHPTPKEEVERARAYVLEQFRRSAENLRDRSFKEAVAVAGTPTVLAALEWGEPFSETRVHGFKLSQEMISKWIETLAPLSIEDRQKFAGMQPKRADVIVMGSVILLESMKMLGVPNLTVSTRGVRYGLAKEMSQT